MASIASKEHCLLSTTRTTNNEQVWRGRGHTQWTEGVAMGIVGGAKVKGRESIVKKGEEL